MPRRRAWRTATVLLGVLAGACGREGAPGAEAPPDSGRASSPPAAPVRLTDAAGRTVTLPEPADRVVSLVPSATLTLDALDAREALVGRTDFDTASWAADIPSVGGGLEPNLEAIVALEPDAVIRFAGEQDPDTPDRLDALGIPHAAIRPDGIADVLESIRIVGELVGRTTAADSLTAALESRLDSIRRARAGGERPRVAYLLGGTPPWVAGPGTYIHELIELAGGENVFADLGSLYASVSPEELVAREIDVILTRAGGESPERFAGGIPVRRVTAALELPGPGMARAAAEVAELIHGDAPP